ncbi:MAG: acylphosphatase [Patescibacteria group bacterium]|nr:acylphosphatase [Patescibacteria group bacterium]
MPKSLYRIRITGRVQGVFYRMAAKEEALRLRLAGFARNEPDGSVLIEAEGDLTALKKYLDWCGAGPEVALVKGVQYEEASPVGHVGFRVL